MKQFKKNGAKFEAITTLTEEEFFEKRSMLLKEIRNLRSLLGIRLGYLKEFNTALGKSAEDETE